MSIKVEQGRQAVWKQAQECGLADDIKKIAQYFDIADISIISGDKMTFLNERPRKMHRVPAIPTKINYKEVIEKTKEQKRYFKK